ncbi:MAG TPA: sugar phosphate nucleotidyltransferase [Terriglobales bacterium]|nr:sugar phosphate nucleotidyltransferase [Terriglobales bacterium]
MADKPSLPVVVLCGGQGTRLRGAGRKLPKPLIEIGGKPILWHILRIYASQGYRDFTLCLGFRGQLIRELLPVERGWRVRYLDTGEATPTGGRIAAAAALQTGPFFATYGDGLADIDLHALAAFHRAHGAMATLTAVRPRLPFGLLRLDGAGRVAGFREKPRLRQWINGGFFVFDQRFARRLDRTSVLEAEPLEEAARQGQLHAYRHHGFWACMDTYKDQLELNRLWQQGHVPWLRGPNEAAPRAAMPPERPKPRARAARPATAR